MTKNTLSPAERLSCTKRTAQLRKDAVWLPAASRPLHLSSMQSPNIKPLLQGLGASVAVLQISIPMKHWGPDNSTMLLVFFIFWNYHRELKSKFKVQGLGLEV